MASNRYSDERQKLHTAIIGYLKNQPDFPYLRVVAVFNSVYRKSPSAFVEASSRDYTHCYDVLNLGLGIHISRGATSYVEIEAAKARATEVEIEAARIASIDKAIQLFELLFQTVGNNQPIASFLLTKGNEFGETPFEIVLYRGDTRLLELFSEKMVRYLNRQQIGELLCKGVKGAMRSKFFNPMRMFHVMIDYILWELNRGNISEIEFIDLISLPDKDNYTLLHHYLRFGENRDVKIRMLAMIAHHLDNIHLEILLAILTKQSVADGISTLHALAAGQDPDLLSKFLQIARMALERRRIRSDQYVGLLFCQTRLGETISQAVNSSGNANNKEIFLAELQWAAEHQLIAQEQLSLHTAMIYILPSQSASAASAASSAPAESVRAARRQRVAESDPPAATLQVTSLQATPATHSTLFESPPLVAPPPLHPAAPASISTQPSSTSSASAPSSTGPTRKRTFDDDEDEPSPPLKPPPPAP